MKTINSVLLALFIAVSIFSCTDSAKSKERKAANDLKQFVDSVNNANNDYTHENWVVIENGYNARAKNASLVIENMSDEEKAELDASKKKYEDLKVKYDQELAKKFPVIDSRTKLRNSLFGEGVIGEDMAFAYVNSQNILSTYQAFVDAVDANKDVYTREDWDEIKLLYEALDTRKNAVEKELSGEDNRSIAALKIKIATLYTVNRPASKSQENSDAKV